MSNEAAEAIAAMQRLVGEAMSKAPLATIEETIRKTIEDSGITDEFEIVVDSPTHISVNFKVKVPRQYMVTVKLPEGISLTDEEIEAINAEYGGGS